MIPLFWLANGAFADTPAASRDVELVRPEFSDGSVLGVDSPRVGDLGDVRVGTLVQLEQQPVVRSLDGAYAGDVISNRLIATTGIVIALSRRTAVRMVLPFAVQKGGDDALAANGGAVGDLDLGVRFVAVRAGPVTLGVNSGLVLPFGTPSTWMSEPLPRVSSGVLGELAFGRMIVTADVGADVRDHLGKTRDLTSGPTLDVGVAARYEPPASTLSVATAFVGRTALGAHFGGAAETPSELLTTLVVGRDARIAGTVGAGVGVTGGVGAARWRVLAGLTWSARVGNRLPRRIPGPSDYEEEESYEEDVPDPCRGYQEATVAPEQEARPWTDDELVRAEQEEIVLRDPIQFAFGTADVLPVSLPTLAAMAALLRENLTIRSLLIEGHASDEGSFAYNFDLSDRRARAIFMSLVAAGVSPERLSYRGMGEVAPPTDRPDDGGTAGQRRVVFRIVARSLGREPDTVQATEVIVPWTGHSVKVEPPPPVPDPPDAAPEAPLDPDPYDFDEDDE
jgi:outer membrane protein OmpA-like peptidoglycan-associated protein